MRSRAPVWALLAFACAHSQPPAPPPARIAAEHVGPVAECPTKNPDLAPGTGWRGEVRADYEVDEHGAVRALRLDDFGDGAPDAVLQAISRWLRQCRFEPTPPAAQVTQFFQPFNFTIR